MKFFQNKSVKVLLILAVLAFALRMPGLHFGYYQDEYKWANIVAVNSPLAGALPHPPLSEKIYVATDRIFGNENLRFTPFIFSIFNIFLIYLVVKYIFDRRTALISAALFAVSYYSILASNMVDTDGQILPFLMLLMAYAYLRARDATNLNRRLKWGITAFVFLVIGFLTKMSFVIPAVALVVDFIWDHRSKLNKKFIVYVGSAIIGFIALFVLFLVNAKYIFPSFDLGLSLKYWEHFIVFSNRNWGQAFIQVAKSIMYLSPLLILPVFLVSKEIFRKAKFFFIFSVSGLLFYLVAFDFSGGALDRYFQFLIVPLCIISGAVFAKKIEEKQKINQKILIWGSIITFIIFLLQFIPHTAFPLHPKSAWLAKVFLLKWNFLFPFMGGSGPSGFYISWLFIALIWVGMSLLVVLMFKYKQNKKAFLIIFLIMGVVYNIVFAQEYMFGTINGNSKKILQDSLVYIKNNPEIKKVVTYNDIGAYELMNMDKYRKRLYVDPMFDVNEKIKSLNQYKEFYLVLDIPKIEYGTVYEQYLNSCKTSFEEKSGYISVEVLDCRQVKDIGI